LLPSGPKLLALVSIALALGLFFLLYLSLGVSAQLLNPAFGLWFTEIFVFLGASTVLVRLSGREPLRYAGMGFPGWAPLAFGFAVGAVNFLALVVPIQSVAQWLAPAGMKEQFDASYLFKNQTTLELALIIEAVGIAAPICEEYAFRGVLQQGLLQPVLGSRPALWVSAIAFSAFHMDPIGFSARVELGLLFGILFYWSRSIWPGAMAHAANNLVSTAIYLAFGGSPAEEKEPSWSAVLLMAVSGMLLLLSLFAFARAHPSVLTVRHPAEVVPLRKQRSLRSVVLPWMAAAVASIGVLAMLDHRGIELNIYDLLHQLPRLSKGASEAARREREELRRLRKEARQGTVPLEQYFEERRRLSRRSREGYSIL
jgi:membrane protease YdiL (CAAX protease family)